jgi:hypothetical protein
VPLDRARLLPAAAALLVALALAASLVELPKVAADAVRAADRGRPARLERESAPGQALGIPSAALGRVRAVIPEGARWTLVLGDTIPLTDTARVGIAQFLRYWLAPRPFVDEPDDAEWVVAYGASSETLGVPVAREVPLGDRINAVEVGR